MTTPPAPAYEFQSDGLRLLTLIARSDPDRAEATPAPAGAFVPWIGVTLGIPSRATVVGAVLSAMRATDGMDGPALWSVELAIADGDWDGAERLVEQILSIDLGGAPFAAELDRRLVEAGRGEVARRG